MLLSSQYISLFFGYGDDSFDTRRMSVLESVPLWRLGELFEYLGNLCSELGGDAQSAQVVQEWKQSYYSLRNRVPQAPPNYADEAFGVYKKKERLT